MAPTRVSTGGVRLKLGLQLPWYDWPGSADADIGPAIRSAGVRAEAAGFASLWVMDHFFPIEFDSPPFPRAGTVNDPMLESYAVLSYLAACTTTIALGPLVAGAIYRHPSVLVKSATALDVLSGGRSYFGVGAGWYAREARGLGIPYPDQDERYVLLEETVRIARHLWSGDRTPFVGQRFMLEEPINQPQPLRRPHPPILIGGGGEQRTLRLVARYADACNLYFGAGPTEYEESCRDIRHKLEVLRRHCDAVGRDISEIEVTALGSVHLGPGQMNPADIVSLLNQVADAGVSHAIVNMPNAFEPGVLERFGDSIIPAIGSAMPDASSGRRRPRAGTSPARPNASLAARLLLASSLLVAAACDAAPRPTSGPATGAPPTSSPGLVPSSTLPSSSPRIERRGEEPVLVGAPIELTSLEGKIVFDDFEDVFTMNADGSGFHVVSARPGAEFDGAWSPDGKSIVYRDSRRGINDDDELYIAAADGSQPRNLTKNSANDWGPDWSPDGRWIAFNSDRDGTPLRGYLIRPDGSDVRPIQADTWFEYPSFSPDGTSIVFTGHAGSDYDIYVVEIATGRTTQLTDSPGADSWPVWSPDGKTIAFTSERDDCARVGPTVDCWRGDEPGEHHDIWIMNVDGTDQRRVTPEIGQFVAWSPDGRYLLISGHTLFVVRPDGTGRVEIRPPEMSHAPGGIPDWTGAP